LIPVQPTLIVWAILEDVLGFVNYSVSKETKHVIIHL